MTETIVLADKLQSAVAQQLLEQLAGAKGSHIHIDGRKVLSIGARAAEILARFKYSHEANGGTVELLASADLSEDLEILGMAHALLGKAD